MCLSTVDAKPTRKQGIGYKVVEKLDGRYLSWDCIRHARTVEYPIGQWLEDKNGYNISASDGSDYPTGFHVVLTQSVYLMSLHNKSQWDSKTTVVIKCRFRKVVATGTDSCGRTVIAREIINLGEIEA